MIDWPAVSGFVVSALLAVGAYALYLLKKATEASITKAAEQGALEAIKTLRWPAELGRELQKGRGLERQELRFKSYAALWKQLRPLAIYDTAPIARTGARDLSSKLSDWYFSDSGGLLLTRQSRDFYFALQDLLGIVSRSPDDWVAERTPGAEGTLRKEFRSLLEARSAAGALAALSYVEQEHFDDWPEAAPAHAEAWRADVRALADHWQELSSSERFTALQQTGSLLRTCMVNDLESRVR